MIEWKVSAGLVPLPFAIKTMEHRVSEIYIKKQEQLIWMLEHPHVYSGGTSCKNNHLLGPVKIPVQITNRGGSYTYHGPGQRILYVMLDLNYQGRDIRKFVWNLEEWLIVSLRDLGVFGERRKNRVGIWITPEFSGSRRNFLTKESKIASIGLRVKNWVTYFGASINVNPDLKFFNGIVPCGNHGFGVTSLKQLGFDNSLTEVDRVLQQNFERVFSLKIR